MTTGPERAPPIIAASKNAEAAKLMAAGKFRQALRVLNEAIYASPDYPHSYAKRAIVFDRLGLAPQAEGDRRRAVGLAESGGFSESEVFALPAPRRPPASRPSAPPPPRTQRRPQQRRRRLAGLSETAVVMVALSGLAVSGAGLYLAADTVGSVDINLNFLEFDSFQTSSEPDEATPEATPSPTPEPTPPPVTPAPEVLAGKPFAFSTLQDSWKAKGLEATIGAINPAFVGFKITPFDVTLTRGGASATFHVLIYPDANGPTQDWNLGNVPSPQSGRRTPSFERGWYNRNVIVLLRGGSPDVANEAKTAFLAL